MKKIIAFLCLAFALLPALFGCSIVKHAVAVPVHSQAEKVFDEIVEINGQIIENVADEIIAEAYNLNPYELGELKKLQFQGYRDLTVDEYNERISEMLDDSEYVFLIDEYLNGEQINLELREGNCLANYFYYVLGPLTCAYDNGQFGEYLTKKSDDGSFKFCLEYDAYIEVLKPEIVTVGEYEQTLDSIKNTVRDMFRETEMPEDSRAYYENAAQYEKRIENKIQDIASGISNDKLRVSIDYVIYIEETEELFYYDPENYEDEKLQLTDLDEEYLNSLLDLMAEDCNQMPLGEFNAILLDWANKDARRSWRIDELVEDGSIREFDLTEEHLNFIETAVELSGMENGKYLEYMRDRIERRPYRRIKLEETEPFIYFECAFSYEIGNPNNITVGERDKAVKGAEKEIQNYWLSLSTKEKLNITDTEHKKDLEKIAEECSVEGIKIYIENVFLDSAK